MSHRPKYLLYYMITWLQRFVFTFYFNKTVPTARPGDVRVATSTKTSLNFTWNALQCGTRGGIIKYYYTLETTPPIIDITSSTSVLFQDLDSCTTHPFKVRAVNSIGVGPEVSISGTTLNDGKLGFQNNNWADAMFDDLLFTERN